MMPNAAMTPYMPPPPLPPSKSRFGTLKSRKPTVAKVHKDPPGPPCGLPPSFDDSRTLTGGTRNAQFSEPYGNNYGYEIDEDDLAPVEIPDSLLPPRSTFQPVRSLISAPPLPPNMSAVPPPVMSGYQRYTEPPQRQQALALNSIIAAPPEMSPRSTMSSMATISAEPQMRNLKKEVTRFVPTSLHVRRPDTTKPKPLVPSTFTFAKPRAPAANRVGKSADQACDEFLKEINDLL